jgi:hypothetical protein
MPRPQIAKQIDFSKGLYAAVNRFEQPPGTIHSISNLIYDKDGALQTCDGSLIVSSLNAAGPVSNQNPFRQILRYADTGLPVRLFALQPTGTNVNLIDVTSVSWTAPDITLASTYDLPNAVQAGDYLAVALGAGITPALLDGGPLAVIQPWQNTWSANANIPSWIANINVQQGQSVQPSAGANGHIYIAQNSGTTGATEPTFPTTSGATVTDGQIVWQEAGLVAPPIPPGADFFFFHMGFLWAWGTNTDYGEGTQYQNLDGPDSLRMSDLNNFTSWNPLNQTFLGKGDGTKPQGGAVMTLSEAGIAATDQIVLFKDTSSYIVLGALGPSAQIRRVPTGVGCIAPGTIAFIEELGVVRLSERGVTVFDGQNDSVEQWTNPIKAYLFGGLADIAPVDWSQIRYAKACRVQNPPAYLLACPLAHAQAAGGNVSSGTPEQVAAGGVTGTIELPLGVAVESVYLTTSWDTSIWVAELLGTTLTWAVDTPAPAGGGYVYWTFGAGTGVSPALARASSSSSSAGALTRLFIYHLTLQAWAVIDIPFAISTLAYIPENPYPPYPAYTVTGGWNDGTVRRLFAGDPDWDGVPIQSMVTLPEIGNPVTPAYIKQIAIHARSKYGVPCGFTGTLLQWMNRDGRLLSEALYIAPFQVPVYVNVDKTVISGSLQLLAVGPLLIEGLEIAAQPKRYMSFDINRDGGEMSLDQPASLGPLGAPVAGASQGQMAVGQNASTIEFRLTAETQNVFVSLATTWNTTYWIVQIGVSLIVGFSTPAPANASVYYNVIPDRQLNPVITWPVSAGSFFTSVSFAPQAGTYTPVITLNWNTKCWITAISATGFTVAFSAPAPAQGGVVYYTIAQ